MYEETNPCDADQAESGNQHIRRHGVLSDDERHPQQYEAKSRRREEDNDCASEKTDRVFVDPPIEVWST
jgi:hypothetical protein